MSAVIVALLTGPVAVELSDRRGEPEPVTTLRDAAGVLDDFRTLYLKRIPPALLADAQAVAVIPHAVRAGFVVGGRHGRGVVVCRGDDGTWGDPTFVTLTGVSAGLQAGIESADVVLVFRTRKSLERVLTGKGKLTLGADAAVAAGPLGREAAAGTDARLEAEVYSYSRSRGLFAGVAVEGAVLANDRAANAAFGRDARPEAVKAADGLRLRLTELVPPKPGGGLPTHR